MATIDVNEIKYLAFEGGGGKGIVYKGVIRPVEDALYYKNDEAIRKSLKKLETTLEGYSISDEESESVKENLILIESYRSSLPLFPLICDPESRHLKGIAGASAGAITAFMLACGLSSADIDYELGRTTYQVIAGFNEKITMFETFLEEPSDTIRIFNGVSTIQKFNIEDTKLFNNVYDLFTGFRNLKANAGISLLLKEQLVINKIFFADVQSWYGFGKLKKLWGNSERSLRFCMALYYPRQMIFRKYLEGLSFRGGIFGGHKTREYFSEIMQTYVINRLVRWNLGNCVPEVAGKDGKKRKKVAIEITFRDFFSMVGVDLVVSSVNITQNRPLYFSVGHTPDFPVVDAIGLSMSIPGAFRPFLIDADVNFTPGLEGWNQQYYGLHVDGGMLNNYPIHAFDLRKKHVCSFRNGVSAEYVVASYGALSEAREFKSDILGFRLEQTTKPGLHSDQSLVERLPFQTREEVRKHIAAPKGIDRLGLLLGDLYGSISYPAEEGNINNQEVSCRTVILNTSGIDLLDFATPEINGLRGGDKQNAAKTIKETLINKAKETVEKLIK